MKITNVRTLFVNPGGIVDYGTGFNKSWAFVKIETDAGITGIGEAFHSLDELVDGAITKYRRWLVGQDPARINFLWQGIYRGLRYPLGTAELSALSAVEHALWDIKGKLLNVPVYSLLGGPTRDHIRLAANPHMFGRGDEGSEMNDIVACMKILKEKGFTAAKFSPQPEGWERMSTSEVVAQSALRIKRIREAVGDEIDLCLDYHGRDLNPATAIRLARELEPFHPLYYEEPVMSQSSEMMVEARAKINIPIAAGERAVTRTLMNDLIVKKAVHIIEPEPTANGGIWETLKLAAMAEMFDLLVAPHQAQGPVSLMVCAHIDASINNFLIQEFNDTIKMEGSCYRDVFIGGPVIRDGHLVLPDEPGLGIDINEEAAKDYPFKPYDRPIIFNPDGSVGLE